MAMAQRLDVYHGSGDGAKAGGDKQGSKKFKKQNKKGSVAVVQNEAEKTVQTIQLQKKQSKGKGRQGQQKKGKTRDKQFKGKCFNYGGDHPLRNCKEWKEMRQKLRTSGN